MVSAREGNAHAKGGPPDAVEVAKARAEYGEAMRELRTLREALLSRDATPAEKATLRRKLGPVEDRVARAAAKLSALADEPR